ncbi:MAG: serine/threonine-protein phosphatase [Synergistaceae bacterium]|jgi:protein phosphatase|nr:serine/threonine-protein phosphatase [Synergistaceae bacterium]
MNVTFITHRGVVRTENQDAVCVSAAVRTGDMTSPEAFTVTEYPLTLAVIDGMGGYEGGRLAARVLAETFSEAVSQKIFPNSFDPAADEDALRRILTEASARMRFEADAVPSLSAMGAAVAGIVLRERGVTAFNCGDCRAYRVSGGETERLTRDHSIVQALFERGDIDEEGMRTHPRKNVMTSAVTAGEQEEPDIFVRGVSRIASDAFFICSDGVWEALSGAELKTLLANSSPETAAALFRALMASGCKDNVSFILAAR